MRRGPGTVFELHRFRQVSLEGQYLCAVRNTVTHAPLHQHKLYEPSISAGLSKSIRRMRPVERARMRTLLATSAATKSDGMANWSETLSMLNMGRDASTS